MPVSDRDNFQLVVSPNWITEFRQRGRHPKELDPMAHAGTFGYQSVQGFIALGSGGGPLYASGLFAPIPRYVLAPPIPDP